MIITICIVDPVAQQHIDYFCMLNHSVIVIFISLALALPNSIGSYMRKHWYSGYVRWVLPDVDDDRPTYFFQIRVFAKCQSTLRHLYNAQ